MKYLLGTIQDNKIVISEFNLSEGWSVFRPKTKVWAEKLAKAIQFAATCDYITGTDKSNANLVTIVKGYGSITKINKEVEVDACSLLRACCCDAGFDPGALTLKIQKVVLSKCSQLEDLSTMQDIAVLYSGDIVVSEEGCGIIISDVIQPENPLGDYYPALTVKAKSFASALSSCGETDITPDNRAKIAKANGISNYENTEEQNGKLMKLIKAGKLHRA